MSIEMLADRVALQDLMLKYAAGIDDRDYRRYRSCFADDVEVIGFGSQTYLGVDAWLDYVWTTLDKYSASQHLLGPQLATLDGDTAHTRSDVQALHYFKSGEFKTFMLWATYVTDMVRINGEWKIKTHRLVTRGSKAE